MISSNTIYSLVLLFLVTGCASTPVWVEGTDRNDFYYQGVGVGPSASQAERNASLDLCANIHGIEVEQVIEDYQRERSTRYELDTESSFQQWMSTYVEGRVPAEARIVERWKGQGQFWAYAIVEKPGQKKRIQRLYDRALEDVKLHSLLPGWAQFQKRQLHKGWLYPRVPTVQDIDRVHPASQSVEGIADPETPVCQIIIVISIHLAGRAIPPLQGIIR